MKRHRHTLFAIRSAHRAQRSPIDLAEGVAPTVTPVAADQRAAVRPTIVAAAALAAALVTGFLLWPATKTSPAITTIALEVTPTDPPTQQPAPAIEVEQVAPRRRSVLPPALPTIRQATVRIPARPPIARMPAMALLPPTSFTR